MAEEAGEAGAGAQEGILRLLMMVWRRVCEYMSERRRYTHKKKEDGFYVGCERGEG